MWYKNADEREIPSPGEVRELLGFGPRPQLRAQDVGGFDGVTFFDFPHTSAIYLGDRCPTCGRTCDCCCPNCATCVLGKPRRNARRSEA